MVLVLVILLCSNVVQATTVWEFTPPYDDKLREDSGGSVSGIGDYDNDARASFLSGEMEFYVDSWAAGFGEASSWADCGIYKNWECPRTSVYRITFETSYDGIYAYVITGKEIDQQTPKFCVYEADFSICSRIYDDSEGAKLNDKTTSIFPFPLKIFEDIEAEQSPLIGGIDFTFTENLEKGHVYKFAALTEAVTHSGGFGFATAGGKIDFGVDGDGVKLKKIIIEPIFRTVNIDYR